MALSTVYTIRVVASVFQALGLFLTAWRIYIRLLIGRFWWEDFFAGAMLIAGALFLASEWIYLRTYGLISIINVWIYTFSFTCIPTLTRLSVLFSIIRIIEGSPRLLKFTYACGAFDATCWLILVIEKAVQCSDPSWHHQRVKDGMPYCRIKPSITIFQLTSGCIATFVLVVLPPRMLWRVKLPVRQKRMILSLFASSVLLAFGAIFHTTGQLLDVFILMTAGINVHVTVSLFVCNLLVVVTYTYHHLLRDRRDRETAADKTTGDDDDDDDFTTRITHPVLTTALGLTAGSSSGPYDRQATQTTESSVYA